MIVPGTQRVLRGLSPRYPQQQPTPSPSPHSLTPACHAHLSRKLHALSPRLRLCLGRESSLNTGWVTPLHLRNSLSPLWTPSSTCSAGPGWLLESHPRPPPGRSAGRSWPSSNPVSVLRNLNEGTWHSTWGSRCFGDREEKASLNESVMIKSSAVPVLRPTSCALVETLSLIHYLSFLLSASPACSHLRGKAEQLWNRTARSGGRNFIVYKELYRLRGVYKAFSIHKTIH